MLLLSKLFLKVNKDFKRLPNDRRGKVTGSFIAGIVAELALHKDLIINMQKKNETFYHCN